MASILTTHLSSTVLTALLLLLSAVVAADDDKKLPRHGFSMNLGEEEEQTTHLHFYFQDISSGPHPTVIRVAEAPTTKASKTLFGAVNMIDDALTEGPNVTSKIVGRAQGFYTFASQEEYNLLMAMNFVFTEGEYNGSTLAVLGRNSVLLEVRELPVVGGSGRFRLARGYALAKTHLLNLKTGDVTVEYDVYVIHH